MICFFFFFFFKNIIEELGLICFSLSTDGDNGINHYHKENFNDFDVLLDDSKEVVAIPKSGHPILDIYHVLKTQREKFFHQNLALSPFSPIFNCEQIRRLVKRGKCFTDHDEAIRFEDDYALDFFSLYVFLGSDISNRSHYILLLFVSIYSLAMSK